MSIALAAAALAALRVLATAVTRKGVLRVIVMLHFMRDPCFLQQENKTKMRFCSYHFSKDYITRRYRHTCTIQLEPVVYGDRVPQWTQLGLFH